MRYDHHREPPLFAKAKQEFVKTLAGLGIQVAGRLVSEQHERFVRECPCHRHALLFPTGQLPGLVVLSVVDPHVGEQGPRLLSSFDRCDARYERRHHHVFQRGEFAQQVMELEDEPHVAVAHVGEFFVA